MKEVKNMEIYVKLQEIYDEHDNIDDKPEYFETLEKLLKLEGKI